MLDLLPGYEHDIEQGAGLPVYAGADKVVIHTTESPRGSFSAIRNDWDEPGKWNAGLPHFLADKGRVVQLLPLSVNAYTLENKPGGSDTNKCGHVIQVEWCRYSRDQWQDDEINALGKWLADLKNAGLNFDINQHPRFYGANEGIVLASYSSPIRMGATEWTNFNGWCGHQHAPENAHWDPGFLSTTRVVNIAQSHLNGGSTPPEDEEVTVICSSKDGRAFACWGLLKRHLSPDELNAYKYLGAKDLGVNDGFLNLMTEIPRGKIAGV